MYSKYNALMANCMLILIFFVSVAISDDNGGDNQEYVIGYGDQLQINVVGHEKELTALAIVRPDGMITYDVVGDMKAEGLTIAQLALSITSKLSEVGYYDNPHVTVQLKESRQDIYVIGDVIDPGMKKFTRPANVIQALASAGGYKETADLANAMIIKGRNEIVHVNLEPLKIPPPDKITEFFKDKYMLKNGDALVIPSAIKDSQVNVIGHVHKPGKYPVKSDITIIEAIALAGGALEDTADIKHISIVSEGNIKSVDATIAWRDGENPNSSVTIKPGDSVVVPERGKITVLGIVENQGQFAVDSEITIIDALALAGIKPGADLKRIRVVKSTGQEMVINVSKLWKNPGKYSDKVIGAGDTVVVSASRFDINWNAVYTVILVFSTLYAIIGNITK
jgi:polysaccharide biosynthesis/export protein